MFGIKKKITTKQELISESRKTLERANWIIEEKYKEIEMMKKMNDLILQNINQLQSDIDKETEDGKDFKQ